METEISGPDQALQRGRKWGNGLYILFLSKHFYGQNYFQPVSKHNNKTHGTIFAEETIRTPSVRQNKWLRSKRLVKTIPSTYA